MKCPECEEELPDRDRLERDLAEIVIAKSALELRLSFIVDKYQNIIQLISAHEQAEEESGD